MAERIECPRCYEGFFWFREFKAGAPAKPRRRFGLLAAEPARPDQWSYVCAECGKTWRTPFTEVQPCPPPQRAASPRPVVARQRTSA